MCARKSYGSNAKELRCILKYMKETSKFLQMRSKFNRDVYNYEPSWMERACQEKQVFGNLLHHMDPRNDLGSESRRT